MKNKIKRKEIIIEAIGILLIILLIIIGSGMILLLCNIDMTTTYKLISILTIVAGTSLVTALWASRG